MEEQKKLCDQIDDQIDDGNQSDMVNDPFFKTDILHFFAEFLNFYKFFCRIFKLFAEFVNFLQNL